MFLLENVPPHELMPTNENEPQSLRTLNYLIEQLLTGNWQNMPPIYALLINGQMVVFDGNHRRDFAAERGLFVPKVIVLENDSDWGQARESFATIYSKIISFDQLARLLLNRI